MLLTLLFYFRVKGRRSELNSDDFVLPVSDDVRSSEVCVEPCEAPEGKGRMRTE